MTKKSKFRGLGKVLGAGTGSSLNQTAVCIARVMISSILSGQFLGGRVADV